MLRSTLTSVMQRLMSPEERTANTFKRRALKHLWGVRHPVVARALREKVFIIYTMGRVGTVSLRDAIQRTAPYTHIGVTHYLTETGLRDREAFRGNPDRRSRRIREFLHDSNDSTVPHLITLVRDPVARDVSSVAKEAQVRRYSGTEGSPSNASDLQRAFFSNGPKTSLGWMDEELGAFLGMNPYAVPFSHEQGYQIRDLDRGRLLILKLSSLSRSFSAAMQQFVGCSFADPLVRNNSSDGHMGDVNRAFSKALTLSNDLLDTYYNSRFARHFFTEPEREQMRSRWAKPS